MSSGGSQSTSNKPWSGVQPYLIDLFGKAQGNLGEFTPEMSNALSGAKGQQDSINNWMNTANTAKDIVGGGDYLMRGGYDPTFGRVSDSSLTNARSSQGSLDPTNTLQTILSGGQANPYLGAMHNANINDSLRGYQDAMQMVNQQVMPGIRGDAIQAGGYGGSRQGIAEGMVGQQLAQNARDLGIGAMDAGNQLYGGAYNNMQNQQYGAAMGLNAQGLQNEQFNKNLAFNNNSQELEKINQQLTNRAAGLDFIKAGMELPGYGYDQTMGLLDAPNQYSWDQMARYASMLQPGLGFSRSTTSSKPGLFDWFGAIF